MMTQDERIESTAEGRFYCTSDPTHLFRRVAGGLAWPSGSLPGFLVVLAEDFKQDFYFRTRHVRVVHEQQDHGGQPFITLEPLLRAAVTVTGRFKVYPWLALKGIYARDIAEFNREQAGLRKPQIRPIQPPNDPGLEYCAALVRKRIYDQKTLHLGSSTLMPRLAALPDDLAQTRFEDHPEVTALFLSLAGLELLRPPEGRGRTHKRTRAAADPAAGY